MDKYEQLKQIINNSQFLVFFGGAGVSTESNIPDFRSDNGIYQKQKYPYPAEQMLSRSFFDYHKKAFYEFYLNEMLYPNALPNKAHLALAKLEQANKLKAIITQNIDGLHQKAGSKKVIELHGNTDRNYCMGCQKFYNMAQLIKYRGICPACQNYIKPDVVLYEEALDATVIEDAINYISQADTLIVGGTSLSVYPAASFIRYFRGKNLILINKTPTDYDKYATLVINDSIGKVLSFIID